MNNEIAALRGRLAFSKKTIETLSAGIDGDISELRNLADKYEPKESLNTDRMKLVVDRIHNQKQKLLEFNNIVISLKRDLGE